MSDVNREFELEIWEASLSFGVYKGNSITTDSTSEEIDFITSQSKGEITNAILGRIIKRTSIT